MRVISLGSGSSGNALFIEAGLRGRTKLLIDAGFSVRTITDRLSQIGVQPSELLGVLLTHEHSDHVTGLPGLIKRYQTPVVADPRTLQVVKESIILGAWKTDMGKLVAPVDEEDATRLSRDINTLLHTHPLPVGTSYKIGDIDVTSFAVSHDAVAPSGFLLQSGGCRVCVVIDSGEVTAEMLTFMRQADLLILESNHDVEKLLRGPYTQNLKMRILSPKGHLSNDQAADAILRTWCPDGVRWLWLSHLSRTNNTPLLALNSIRASLKAAGVNLSQIHLSTLPPNMGGIWDSTQLWRRRSLWEMSL